MLPPGNGSCSEGGTVSNPELLVDNCASLTQNARTGAYSNDIQAISAQDDDLKRRLRVTARIGAHHSLVVPRTSVLNFLEGEHKRKQNCFVILPIVAHSFAFTFLLVGHRNTSDLSQVEREFRSMITGTSFEGYGGPISHNKLVVSGHKTLEDVDVIDDVYTFLQDAFLGLMIRDTANERVQDHYRVLSYNQLIGSIRLVQIRKKRLACSSAYPDLGPFDAAGDNPFLKNFDCFPADSIDDSCFGPPGEPREGFCPDKMRSTYTTLTDSVLSGNASRQLEDSEGQTQRPRARRLSPSIRAARSRSGKQTSGSVAFGSYFAEAFSVSFEPNQGIDVAYQMLVILKRDGFLDEQTSFLAANLFGLNPDLGVFFSCTVNFFFMESGEIVPQATVLTWQSEILGLYVLILDVIFLVLLVHIFIHCLVDLKRAIESKTIAAYAMAPWNVIDWLTAVGGVVVVVMFVQYNVELGKIKESAGQLALATPQANQTSDEHKRYVSKLQDFGRAMAHFVPYLGTCRYIFGSYCLLCLIRLFKAFELQPRLAIVTQTIVKSKTDFAHFMIVFITVFIAFCAAGMPLLGHRLIGFASLTEALIEGSMLVIGNFDYDEMAEEYPISIFVWFCVFIVLLALIMFNMLLAIVMDMYGLAKQEAAFSDTLWGQACSMFTEIRHRGSRMPESEIIEQVSSWSDDMVCRQTLLEQLPGMTEKQADSIIDTVTLFEDHEDELALSLSDALRLIVDIRHQLQRFDGSFREICSVKNIVSVVLKKKLVKEELVKQQSTWQFQPPAEAAIASLEARLDSLESLFNGAMSYGYMRGTEFRDRLTSMEDMLRGTRDVAISQEELEGERSR